ncbi:hypothetical protein HQQ94_06115 [Shewanella sp. VB17]|uniref:hypothetical protein n=1 Tax=Shewanella sp. VB17 TaxID=2739432 RepID=UPI00156695D9|nr:hypothetical protein [Shewanella sp. VB17]NRD72828.1 hypothetical protein [Shewanella sp. VB17]
MQSTVTEITLFDIVKMFSINGYWLEKYPIHRTSPVKVVCVCGPKYVAPNDKQQ